MSRRRGFACRLIAAAFAISLALTPDAASARLLDDFEDITAWLPLASEGAQASASSDVGVDGRALRLDYSFNSTSGYVNVKRPLNLRLPRNYRLSFALRGAGPPNNLEIKLLDPSGRNVWWQNRQAMQFDPTWQATSVWRDQFDFAWGPKPGPPEDIEIGFVEFTVKANTGGRGSVWIDDLKFDVERPAAELPWPPTISSDDGQPAANLTALVDGRNDTAWRSDTVAPVTLTLDLRAERLYGGLVIDWGDDYARGVIVATSDDGSHWQPRFETQRASGRRMRVTLPGSSARFLRLTVSRASHDSGYTIRELALMPYSQSATANDSFVAIAGDAPRGHYPKYLSGEATYWTVIGADGDDKEALLNEEGMLEVDAQSFSIEPFIELADKLVTWHDVQPRQELRDGDLPLPSVIWNAGPLRLTITAFAGGAAGASTLYARYHVENRGEVRQTAKLHLALRPFQVNPPWQSLNQLGGVGAIKEVSRDGTTIVVAGRDPSDVHRLRLAQTPESFDVVGFGDGSLIDALTLPGRDRRDHIVDRDGLASAVASYALDLKPGETRDVDVAVPWHQHSSVASDLGRELAEVSRRWRATLAGPTMSATCAPDLEKLVRTTLAYILINRDGPALQPGSRNYARSWIRDGALTSVALLQLGHFDEARDYLAWYAAHRLPTGRIPCCIDRRGPDPTPEHDADGEFLYAVGEYFRYTRDQDLVRVLWPRIVDAADHLIELRRQRIDESYRAPQRRGFYGLLPESISHEGYAAQPVHSYWDDFFGLRGLGDAASLAAVIGDDERASSYRQESRSFRRDLVASIQWTMANKAIDYIPGSVELGDFDSTATAIGPEIGLDLDELGGAAWHATFDRYYRHFEERLAPSSLWLNYAPYEFRNVSALTRLGQRNRAFAVLTYLVDRRHPLAWNAWPEVVWRDANAPRFLGDLPHTWIGAGFITALRGMFVHESADQTALVLAEGIPEAWIAPSCEVRAIDLPTALGRVSYSMRRASDGGLIIDVSGALRVPATPLHVRPPRHYSRATIDGKPVAFDGATLVIDHLPAAIRLDGVL